MIKYNIQKLFILFILILTCTSRAQNGKDSLDIFEAFSRFTEAPREIAYAHLNKSIYINGETLAFTVYVFNKNTKKHSVLSRNLYCVITDDTGKVIKSKMFLVVNGICSGSFFVDETFTSANYTFKAYTNYMKNFEEQNYYIQNFRVIVDEGNEPSNIEFNKLDVQFLPEGGHLVEGIFNTIGVIITDGLGASLGNISGSIYDQNKQLITNFTTDRSGVAKFDYIPKYKNSYIAEINFKDSLKTFVLDKAEKIGVTMSLVDLNSRIGIEFKTNLATLDIIKNEKFTITIHDGKNLKLLPLVFNKNVTVTKFINKVDLFTGMNVITVFDNNKKPVLERLYFNYENIEIIKIQAASAKIEGDSIAVEIDVPKKDNDVLQNFSISVLPTNTISYSPSHNILSYIYLQPYLRGYLNNAASYFVDMDKRKLQELDNLLITLGWSSYSWKNLFNRIPKYLYKFENGINLNVTLNEQSESRYSLFSSRSDFEMIDISEGQKEFTTREIYPFDDDRLYISALSRNGTVKSPSVYVQFSPSRIPFFENYIKIEPQHKSKIYKDINFQDLIEFSWTGIEQLDEIVLNVRRRQTKIDALRNKSSGQVDEFNAENRYRFRNFETYLRSKGYKVDTQAGRFVISSPGTNSSNNKSPVIYLDGVRVMDNTFLSQLNMSFIDYIIVDKNSAGNIPNTFGKIEIFTDPKIRHNSNSTYSPTEILYPLTFSTEKKFYAPRYSFYRSRFFKDYGVIDWVPKARVNNDGKIKFKFLNHNYENITLFIEGADSNGFISKAIELNIQE